MSMTVSMRAGRRSVAARSTSGGAVVVISELCDRSGAVRESPVMLLLAAPPS
jgi:hypothetical protein